MTMDQSLTRARPAEPKRLKRRVSAGVGALQPTMETALVAGVYLGPDPNGSLRLVRKQERAVPARGTLQVESAVSTGATLYVRLPLNDRLLIVEAI